MKKDNQEALLQRIANEYQKQKAIDEHEFGLDGNKCIATGQNIKKLKRALFKHSVEDTLECIADMNIKMGTAGISFIDWFKDKDLERIFDEDNDANFYNEFANEVVLYLREHPELLPATGRFINGKLVQKQMKIKDFVIMYLNINEDNELHKLFIKVLERFIKFYNDKN